MYQPVKPSRTINLPVRGLNYQVRLWGDADASPKARPLFFLHGWMDVSASFQFVVDCLKFDNSPRLIIAPDWRGYGGSGLPPQGEPFLTDSYWFPDYLADLEAVLDHFSPTEPVDIVAHSMGGNVACMYAGIRPHRVRKLVNLEGFGMPETKPTQAPKRYGKWLDEIKEGASLRPYASLADVAARLQKTNPRLRHDFALWLAQHWSQSVPTPDGQSREYQLLADPAHKHINPTLYRVEEALACWRNITAPVLFVETDERNEWSEFTRSTAYRLRLTAFKHLTLALVEQAGHMLHHDQPQRVAQLIEEFLQ
jgi:pimeloyl-ACP methyl ester carboxylesterase